MDILENNTKTNNASKSKTGEKRKKVWVLSEVNNALSRSHDTSIENGTGVIAVASTYNKAVVQAKEFVENLGKKGYRICKCQEAPGVFTKLAYMIPDGFGGLKESPLDIVCLKINTMVIDDLPPIF